VLEADEYYRDREQSRVKHVILQRYLESFAQIIGFHWSSITYIDGFSGPWNSRAEDFSDTSFSIALKQLSKARETHRTLRLRCVFVESDANSYQLLEGFCQKIEGVEIRTFHSTFERAIPEIIKFVKLDSDTFPFTLIDPKGYSGFAMRQIAPLLRLQPGEVLINFMLEFIRRSIEHGGLRACYEALFGTDDYFESLQDLSGADRDDAIAERYCESLKAYGAFDYVQRASVLHPDKDRLNFQLIYATRHPKGVDVFKKSEAEAMRVQEMERAKVAETKKRKGGQASFLDPQEMPESRYYAGLRHRYLMQARNAIVGLINGSTRVEYDRLWVAALSYPMVWESDLRNWLHEWRDNGILEWHGLATRGRELIHGKSHSVSLVTGRAFP
jgi:three-Cys-motif partner protein